MFIRSSFYIISGTIFCVVIALTFTKINTRADNKSESPTVIAAKNMLNTTLGKWDKLKTFSKIDIAKRMNYLVFNYCKSPHNTQTVSNLDELFKNCVTACGGRSYVLKGLLTVYGINSRYVNLYNLPKQGNHSAIQADINNQHVFLDPTFGTFIANSHNVDDM